MKWNNCKQCGEGYRLHSPKDGHSFVGLPYDDNDEKTPNPKTKDTALSEEVRKKYDVFLESLVGNDNYAERMHEKVEFMCGLYIEAYQAGIAHALGRVGEDWDSKYGEPNSGWTTGYNRAKAELRASLRKELQPTSEEMMEAAEKAGEVIRKAEKKARDYEGNKE